MTATTLCWFCECVGELLESAGNLVSDISRVNKGVESDTLMWDVVTASAHNTTENVFLRHIMADTDK